MSRSKRNAAALDYFRRVPNYSAEATQDLRTQCRGLFPAHTKSRLLALADHIECSHKFALPDGGLLFEETTDGMARELMLPYDSIVLEFSHNDSHGEGKRFADAMLAVIYRADDSDVHIGTLGRFRHLADGSGVWIPHPYSYSVFRVNDVLAVECVPCDRIPELGFFPENLSRDEIWKNGAGTVGVGLEAAVQMCAALSCSNVTTEIVRPNREARAARPASTLFDYHVLMIAPGKGSERGEDLGGSHASPRTHLRRGHIRRHPTAGRIWVNSCVVNPMAIGTVNKDYRVKP